ncbi:hypothetical protein MMC31_002454 [Peltigera leucophlebia]|nr:hypothetical protein [Peltigera leucophlebia]
MFDGLLMLLTLSTVMAVASFLAGSLPLSFPLSQSRLRIISTIGMGVLVGTSLIVIIPEGVNTLYSASEASSSGHARRDVLSRSQGFPSVPEARSRSFSGTGDDLPGPSETTASDTFPSNALASVSTITDLPPPSTPTSANEVHIVENTSTTLVPPSDRTPHVWIGLSLIFGFILMYLLDSLSSISNPSHSRLQTMPNIYSLSDLSSTATAAPPPPSRSFSTTLGLCIHAAADGIALGASISSTTSLSLIIFVAIMVHKAPAAFGLTSVLLKQGLGKKGARAHLIIFSLAAPVGALGTWVVVQTLGGGAGEEQTTRWWTGVLLLFSGGTFLYVAMHTMQDSENPPTSISSDYISGGDGNGYPDGSLHGRGQHRLAREGRSLKLVFVAVVGMLLPLITQIGHAH